VLEINPLPGLNPATGDVAVMAGLAGLPYNKIITGIVDSALARSPRLQR
jgi:D-alanine-D-alanine ligase